MGSEMCIRDRLESNLEESGVDIGESQVLAEEKIIDDLPIEDRSDDDAVIEETSTDEKVANEDSSINKDK